MATQEDDALALLKQVITQGWPSNVKEVPKELQSYWTFREELTIEDGLILKGTRIVIPSKKHEAVLKLIHEGHLGLNKCKLHTKETIYWPGLNDQLDKLILNCELCLKYLQAKCKQLPNMALGQEIPIHPWTKLATDLFHFEGVSYLLVVDYTSRFPVMWKLSSMIAQHVTSHFKLIFSEYGWPNTLVSDNGPCYTAEVFTNLMQEYSMNHITSLPHYPQFNGLTEKSVQIVKNLFYKAREQGTDLHKSLMIYHNTPLTSNLQSLMQMSQDRSARSRLPMSNAVRRQLGLSPQQLRVKTKNEHLPSHDLHIGRDVMYQDSMSKRWFPAVITSRCKEPRSYKIMTREGVMYRKTQVHLKPYRPQSKQDEDKHSVSKKCDMWTAQSKCQNQNSGNLLQSRPKRDIKPPSQIGFIVTFKLNLQNLA